MGVQQSRADGAAIAPGAVSEEKDKVPESSLDLSFITPRIMACGRPSVRESDLEDHRNNLDELGTFLDQRHGDNYAVLNLSNKGRNVIDYSKFHNSVVEFQPYSRTDITDDTPGLGEVFRACYCLRFFLEWGPETVVAAHCNNGVYRTGFVLAAFLVYIGQFDSIAEALAFFSKKRLQGHINTAVAAECGDEDGSAISIASRMMPSWRFLMQQLDKVMRQPPSLPKAFKLAYIIINAPGLARTSDDTDPVVQIFEGPKVCFDSSKDSPEDEGVRWEDGKLIVEADRILCGDYQLWILTPERDRVHGSGMTSALASGAAAPGGEEDAAGPAGAMSARAGHRRERRYAARFVFHTSLLEEGINSYGSEEVDIFRTGIDKRSFTLTLVMAEVPTETLLDLNLDKAMKRSFLNLKGSAAIVKGAEEFSAHHYTFPDAKLLKTLMTEGFDETAAVCALQRAGNNIGKCREYLDAPVMKENFKESAAERDLKLLRETLTGDEVAAALASRANMVIRKRGIGLEELDYRSLLDAAKLGNLGLGGTGDGTGKGKGGGRGRKGKKGKKGKKGGDSDSESSDSSKDDDEEEEDDGDDEGGDGDKDDGNDAAAVLGGSKADGTAPKLFEGDAAGADNDDDDDDEPLEEEEEESGPWLMKEHPIFGRWFKMMADGKSKAEVLEELAKDKFNPALLDVPAAAPVPEGLPASLVPVKDWDFIQKYAKMLKVGLPRPVCEHKMLSENVNPSILDLDPGATVMADALTPPKKKKSNKPSIVRKKLHWVPIRGKVESTIWYGPPGDLVAAAGQLITDEKEFNKLFIQNPEDLKKKKKDKDKGGVVQLLDAKRAMNCGIALAKLKVPFAGVVDCLTRMCCRSGKYLLSTVEIGNLITLCPTEEEVKTLKGYKGDVGRLGQAEKFMLAVCDVPQAKQRAEGLNFQAGFDERVKDTQTKLKIFAAAMEQVRSAPRLKRFLKAVLVLGNKMNGITAKNRKGVVKAFTIQSLHQLHLTKAFDQQTSVLQYLIRLLKHRDPDLLRLSQDFKGETLAQAKRYPLDLMADEVRELRAGLTSLEAVIRDAAQAGAGWASMTAGDGPTYIEEEQELPAGDGKDKDTGGADAAAAAEPAAGAGGDDAGGEAAAGAGGDAPKKRKKKIRRRVEPLPQFAGSAQGEVTRLEGDLEAARGAYKQMVAFWKEDAQMAPDDLFGNLHMFLQTYDSVLNAMADKKRKEKEAKKRAKEMAKQKKRMAKQKRKAARKAARKGSDDDDESSSEESSSSESESSEEEEEEEESSSDEEGAGAGAGSGAWTAGGAAAADDDDDDEEEEEESGSAGGGGGGGGSAAGAGGNPRNALLAAIKGKAGGGGDNEAGSSGGGGGGGGGSDPRSGLLAAIRGKASGGGDAAKPAAAPKAESDSGGSSGDPRGGLLAAIRKRGDDSDSGAAAGGGSGDPRGGLLAAIRKRGDDSDSGAAAGAGAGSSEPKAKAREEDKIKDTGWRVAAERDDDPEADGRNSLLAAIKAKRKE